MVDNYITVQNLTLNVLSFEGDNGIPRIKLTSRDSTTIDLNYVIGNAALCTSLANLVNNSAIQITRGSNVLTSTQLFQFKYSGDMYKDEYDTDDNSVVDDAEELAFVIATQLDNTSSPYTVLSSDKILEVDTTGGAVSILLPAGVDGKQYIIKDLGNAAVANITITPNGAETIDGGGAVTMNVAYSVLKIYFRATVGWLSI